MHVRPGVQQKLQHTNFKHLSTDASEIISKNNLKIILQQRTLEYVKTITYRHPDKMKKMDMGWTYVQNSLQAF